MPRLTDEEFRQFIHERSHLARIGTVDVDGMPRVVPFWFLVDGERLLFTPRVASVVLANVRRDSRICVSIDEEALPYRKVTVQGIATISFEPGEDDAWRDVYRSICARYVPTAEAETYIQDTIDQPRALLSVEFGSTRISTWRLPIESENKSGIWARRYYQPGTKMARLADERKSVPMYKWMP